MALTKISDHTARAVARLASQYQNSSSVVGLVKLATAEHQVLEDTLFAEFVETVDSAAGHGLDIMGKVVGQPREGRSDDNVYRTWIKARVQVNRCGGTAPEIIAIFMVLCPPPLTLRLEERYPAGFVLRIGGAAAPTPTALVSILRRAKAAGVRGILEYLTAAPSETFSFAGADPGLGFEDGAFAGGAQQE